jgi:hypothetical protein
VTHTYTQAIKQPTLHYLTRSVRRRAATSKRPCIDWSSQLQVVGCSEQMGQVLINAFVVIDGPTPPSKTRYLPRFSAEPLPTSIAPAS